MIKEWLSLNKMALNASFVTLLFIFSTEMVDMTEAAQLNALRLWKGDYKYLQNFNLVRIKKNNCSK